MTEKKEGAQWVKSIPEPTLRRLPSYHGLVMQLKNQGKQNVSCTDIGEKLGLTPIQVRKDIEATGVSGKPKVGYYIGDLLNAIETSLGWNKEDEAFLVGAGNLGIALMGYPGFKDYGLTIVAAFDNDPAKIGTQISGKKILDVKKLAGMIQRMKIRICILTVPGSVAQSITDEMVKAGVVAIWNFSPHHVVAPPHVAVQHENLAASFSVLSSKIRKPTQ